MTTENENLPTTPQVACSECTDDCCCDGPNCCKPEETAHSEYWNFLDELEGTMKAFICEARAGDLNKQAALRARKMSLTIGKSLKEYREVSVAHDKSHVRSRKTTQLSKEIETLNG